MAQRVLTSAEDSQNDDPIIDDTIVDGVGPVDVPANFGADMALIATNQRLAGQRVQRRNQAAAV